MDCPDYLKKLSWYQPHQAWLKQRGYTNLHNDGCAAPTRAVLTGADLTGADLTGAVLTGAVLTRAVLTRAVLTDADLTGADLTDAVLTRAVLTRADLTGADLTGAVLTGADLTGADGLPYTPLVPDIDRRILEAVASDPKALDMGQWHACETTHCRAGWAVHFAGEAGKVMESLIGPATAGALIYHKSAGHVPNFYATNEDSLADMRARVGGV
jgi:uncharacterized protein YjbI with pentapeptide repeats